MRWIIDTNIWLYAAANIKVAVGVLDNAAKADWAGYSAITRLEVFGFPDLKMRDEHKLSDMLGCFNEVAVSGMIIDQAIVIRRKRRKTRVPDAVIAATAILENAVLVTRNTADFENIPSLSVLNPFL